jgi:hypothetical protein
VVETACAELAVEEPEPEQIVAELFAEAPFAADTVQSGEPAGFEELFGRDADATVVGIEFGKGGESFSGRRPPGF